MALLEITKATYGDVDCTELIKSKIKDNRLILRSSNDLIGDTKWIIEQYGADGYFAVECYSKSKSPVIINKSLSTYNQLAYNNS